MLDETDLNQLILDNVGDTLHQRLHTERRLRRVCRHLPTDFQPYGKREAKLRFAWQNRRFCTRTAADCSWGCRHFLELPEPLNIDWGVCINPRSPRSGLLTFEHQGCEFFEAEAEGDEDHPTPDC